MLDAAYDVDVRSELDAESTGFAKVGHAAHEDPVPLRVLWTVVDGAAELALEKQGPVDWNAPGEAREEIARLAARVDHRAYVDARIEKPREPLAANVVGVADRRGQEFGRHVDRRALVVNLVVREDADPYFLEEIGVSVRSRPDDRLGRRHAVVDAQTGHVGRRRRRDRERSPREPRNDRLPPCPHAQPSIPRPA